MSLVDELRGIDLFEGLDDGQLEAWADAAELSSVEPGATVAEQGVTARGLFLLLEGSCQALMHTNGSTEPMGRHVAPTWMGAIGALTGGTLPVQMLAESSCRLAVIPHERFLDLVLSQRVVHRRVMEKVGPVMSRLSATEQHRERLASLGTMAAGLAHELNNPAAAATRAASDLVEAIDTIGSTMQTFVEAGVEREQAERLVVLQQMAMGMCRIRGPLDALGASDAEDAMQDRLEALGVADAWRLAEPLAHAGVDDAWLDEVAGLAGPATDAALRWVAASLSAHTLAAELHESVERMSGLVGAIKRYSYMDRGGVVEVDIHEGLETTLVVLGHKLKHTSIKLERRYDESLPKVMVHGSELNQVWTNLLDNAIAVLGENGVITLTTFRDGDCLQVDIADDGPGIPEDARTRIFEPFFTTKAVGSGTGLGLDTARRIVEERHTGSLTFDTGGGGTTFHVRLPLKHTAR
jgi:signal transduction histidine kinase